METIPEVYLRAHNLTKVFPGRGGIFYGRIFRGIKAVDGASFDIKRGETFGLVGESGSGKTTIARCILLLESATSGSITLKGRNLFSLNKEQLRDFRHLVQGVFQDPMSSLNPRMKIKAIIAEPLLVQRKVGRKMAREKVKELLEVVGLRAAHMSSYPHELSGGQRQRVAICRALSVDPELLILDEPISALDVSIRAQIINLLIDMQEEFRLTYLVIAHDIAVIEHICDRIGVMYRGRLLEICSAKKLKTRAVHPYTQLLLTSIPSPDPKVGWDQGFIQRCSVGFEVGYEKTNLADSCAFAPRCPEVTALCWEARPELAMIGKGHWVACHCV